jgi:APA family basic amino acid/polyamine antiporter
MATKLKRALSLFEVTFYGVGVILGAGIYALIGKGAGLAGNMVWAAFAIGAFIAAFTGLSYAELSSMFPKSGGEYVFAEKAFNKRIAFLIGWLIIIGGVIGSAAVSLGFAGYFGAIFHTPIIPIAMILITSLSLLSLWGIKQSAFAEVIATFVEVGGLIAIILFGLKYIGHVNYTALPPLGFSGILSATALIFFAYLGFEDIVRLSEETKNPTKTIPTALILAIVISTILYIGTAIAAVSVIGWEALSQSAAPLALVAQTALGEKAFIFLAITALCATFTTVLGLLIATSRMLYGMAEDGGMPKIIHKAVHKKFQTPWLAILITGMISTAFVLIGKIELVASLTNFALFVTFALVNLSLLMLRFKQPRTTRPFKTWAILSVFGMMSSIAMLFYLEWEAWLAGAAIIGVGLLACELFRKK